MKRHVSLPTLAVLFTALIAAVLSLGCRATSSSSEVSQQQEVTDAQDETAPEQGESTLADGSYQIEVETDSSMFHADSCMLTVEKGAYTATLVLPGEGFSRLFFGSAEDAASAPSEQVFDYHLNDEGKYAFDLPVAALDEELEIAAFGQRRDTWYPHTIIFHAPAVDGATDAA